jgi:hypothetical protein
MTKQLQLCTFCQVTGKMGANFRMLVDGKAVEGNLHKFCGEKLAQGLPGANVEIVHRDELRRREVLATRKRDEERVSSFWKEKGLDPSKFQKSAVQAAE